MAKCYDDSPIMPSYWLSLESKRIDFDLTKNVKLNKLFELSGINSKVVWVAFPTFNLGVFESIEIYPFKAFTRDCKKYFLYSLIDEKELSEYEKSFKHCILANQKYFYYMRNGHNIYSLDNEDVCASTNYKYVNAWRRLKTEELKAKSNDCEKFPTKRVFTIEDAKITLSKVYNIDVDDIAIEQK